MFSFIPLRLQIYGVLALILILGLLGLKNAWARELLASVEAASNKARLNQLKQANEVSREVQTWDDSHVADVARKRWVRGDSDN